MSRASLLKRIEILEQKMPKQRIFTVCKIDDEHVLFTNPDQNRQQLKLEQKRLKQKYTDKGRKIPENERIVIIYNDIGYIQGETMSIERIKEIRGIKNGL
ncbi:hypothetical protein GCM10011409_45390 [Lentibacillus populi]|uniref:Uncharacterized protein n=1 Tax=Lentibacillus populi TaxID=1827502 RepID=A0A9W5U375_9BACI|nr:hypothetical protein [Lentibacillus populi]GGB63220.1 hypothetical protein GCM10011409_45390 [Lentibacillus populi]